MMQVVVIYGSYLTNRFAFSGLLGVRGEDVAEELGSSLSYEMGSRVKVADREDEGATCRALG